MKNIVSVIDGCILVLDGCFKFKEESCVCVFDVGKWYLCLFDVFFEFVGIVFYWVSEYVVIIFVFEKCDELFWLMYNINSGFVE